MGLRFNSKWIHGRGLGNMVLPEPPMRPAGVQSLMGLTAEAAGSAGLRAISPQFPRPFCRDVEVFIFQLGIRGSPWGVSLVLFLPLPPLPTDVCLYRVFGMHFTLITTFSKPKVRDAVLGCWSG